MIYRFHLDEDYLVALVWLDYEHRIKERRWRRGNAGNFVNGKTNHDLYWNSKFGWVLEVNYGSYSPIDLGGFYDL